MSCAKESWERSAADGQAGKGDRPLVGIFGIFRGVLLDDVKSI